MSNLKTRLKNLLDTVIDFEQDDFTENEDINLIEEDRELFEDIRGISEVPLPRKEFIKRLAKFNHIYSSAVIIRENLKHIEIKKPLKKR